MGNYIVVREDKHGFFYLEVRDTNSELKVSIPVSQLSKEGLIRLMWGLAAALEEVAYDEVNMIEDKEVEELKEFLQRKWGNIIRETPEEAKRLWLDEDLEYFVGVL